MQRGTQLRFPADPDLKGLLGYGILIIDDQRDSAELIHALLESHGFENLRVAHSGEEGLDVLASDASIGLVLLDILMPRMDGYEVCERINASQLWSDIPVIMVTGGGLLQNEALRHSFRSGAIDYISKPINEIELFARVSVALRLFRERQQRKANTSLFEEFRERLRQTMELAPGAIAHIDPQGYLISVSARLSELVSMREQALLGRHFDDFYCAPGPDPARIHRTHANCWADLSEASDRATTLVREALPMRVADGSYVEVNLALTAIKDPSGLLRYFIATVELARPSHDSGARGSGIHHDSLTGLMDREDFKHRLNRLLTDVDGDSAGVAVMFIDLDHFKQVNDSLGHRMGDGIIEQAARRVASSTRHLDVELARLGGDEFGVLLKDVEGDEGVERLATHILHEFSRPLLTGGREIIVTASIGASRFPHDGADAHALMQAADTAMYQAKERGRNAALLYEAGMASELGERLVLEQYLRRAIEKNELRLYYQPQCSIADGRLVGAEALLRWQHPHQGLMSPEEFIPLAEDSGLILEIGQWALNEACNQIAQWQEEAAEIGLSMVPIMVNLSLIQMRTREIIAVLSDVLASTGINPDYLGIELTENIGEINVTEVVEMLHSLHDHGVQIALDDFGSGYSSLSRIKRFPLDLLKIDKDFIREIHEDDDSLAIVRAVIAMAGALNLKVVAEGVENSQQLEVLQGLDCDIAQGFLFGKAMDAQAFQALMRDDASLRQIAAR